MTSFVRTSFASLSTTCALVALLGLAAMASACGGDDGGVTVVDASPDATIDAPIDAAPLVCNAPTMNCGGQCVNTTNNVGACGSCTNMCPAGQICSTSNCACPVRDLGTAAFTGGLGVDLGGQQLNTNTLSGDALVIGINPAMTDVNMAYPMSTTISDLPLAGYAINLQIDPVGQTADVDASFAAVEGTLTFTTVCPDTGSGGGGFPNGGVMGTLTNVKFAAVDGLLSGTPTIVPNGCTIPATGTIASISFTLGNVNCSSAAQ